MELQNKLKMFTTHHVKDEYETVYATRSFHKNSRSQHKLKKNVDPLIPQ